jgi:N-acetylglucosamine kinase-like BadF-type ATPase
MKLIADSGSTKTDWALVENGMVLGKFQTQGINPFHQDDATIITILQDELLPHLSTFNSPVLTLYFYGSGLREEQKLRMNALFKKTFPSGTIFLESDLLGAARALCGREEGIACILGTGANSCLYDGEKIVQNTPPLGYVLGDEGSGAVLGRLFMNAIFKDPQFVEIRELYMKETGLTMPLIINKVYREPLANRFLASTSAFIHQHLEFRPLRQMVVDNFRSFFQRNLVQYQRRDLPVHAVGSIAFNYQEELKEAAEKEGFTIGHLLATPMEGLIEYHQ